MLPKKFWLKIKGFKGDQGVSRPYYFWNFFILIFCFLHTRFFIRIVFLAEDEHFSNVWNLKSHPDILIKVILIKKNVQFCITRNLSGLKILWVSIEIKLIKICKFPTNWETPPAHRPTGTTSSPGNLAKKWSLLEKSTSNVVPTEDCHAF